MQNRNKVFRFSGYEHGVPMPVPRLRDVSGPLSYLNPTSAYFQNASTDKFEKLLKKSGPSSKSDPCKISYYWSSRNNRKGHHTMQVSSLDPDLNPLLPHIESSKYLQMRRTLVRMVTYFPYWDISFLNAILYVVGSLVWLLDAFMAVVPLYKNVHPKFPAQSPWIAFLGTNIFLIANVLLTLETINELQKQCFGWNPGPGKPGDEEKGNTTIGSTKCHHSHANKGNLIGTGGGGQEMNEKETTNYSSGNRTWRWIPSYSELRNHYIHELGFIACLIQLSSTVIFYFAAVIRLPLIYNTLSTNLAYILIWTPKGAGSVGFTVSGWLFMVETQKTWFAPSFGVLGWHVGVLSIVGGVGFILSSLLSPVDSVWAQEQCALSLLWAAIAFLAASCAQWYESLDKYSVQWERYERQSGSVEKCGH